MFSVLKGIFGGESDEAGGNPVTSQDGENSNASASSVYDKDEIRKKRLAKVDTVVGGSGTSAVGGDVTSAVVGSGASAPTDTEDGRKVPAPLTCASKTVGSNEVKAITPVLRASKYDESTTEVGTKRLPLPRINDELSTVMPPMPPAVSLVEINQLDESSSYMSLTTKLSRSDVVLNTLFENILQITLKTANAIEPIKYMGGNGGDNDMIGADDITGLLCNRLVDSEEVNGGIGYLVGCYKRLMQKQKDYDNSSSKTDKIIAENLSKCKEEIVRFIGSVLTEPEAFGKNSENSKSDFLNTLIGLSSSSLGSVNTNMFLESLLSSLSDEIVDSISDIVVGIATKAFQELHENSTSPTTNPSMMMPPCRSIMKNDIQTPAVTVLSLLCRCNKRYASAFTETHNFNLFNDLASADPPRMYQSMDYRQLMHQSSIIENHGVAGAAFEHKTLLGRMLRLFPTVFDPNIMQLFSEAPTQPRSVVEGNISNLRSRLDTIQSCVYTLIMALLRAGGPSKENIIQWLLDALLLNIEAEKTNPSPLVSSSPGFLINLGAVLLEICRPIINDLEKLKKVDVDYLDSSQGSIIFPKGMMMIDCSIVPAEFVPETKQQAAPSFITQSFFMCLRVLHLGVVQQIEQYHNSVRALSRFHSGLANNEPRAIHYLVQKITYDTVFLRPQFLRDIASFCSSAATVLMSILAPERNSCQSISGNWKVPASSLTPTQLRFLISIPPHLISDIVTLLLFISKTDPSVLAKAVLDDMLALIVYFLRRPWALVDYNVRAELGQALYQVFLPSTIEGLRREHWTNVDSKSMSGLHTSLLESSIDAQRYLAPALLLLYGDVERTGYYEKIGFRQNILVILRHLWSIPTHHEAFRGIVTGQLEFISFANGLMNETNHLVLTTMDKLQDIKKTQTLMANVTEWNNLTAENRNLMMERHEENEGIAKSTAGLCLETLSMVRYLTSDTVIRQQFLMVEILPRLVSMLTNILNKIVGTKSLEIKVDNMEAYKFDPKAMLRDICHIFLNFSDYSEFVETLAVDGFYGDGKIYRLALNTVKKLNLLTPTEHETMNAMYEKVEAKRMVNVDLEALTADCPDDFLDPLLMTIMRDPVKLPSGNVVDRSTIAQHLLNDVTDPFNRAHMTISDLIPDLELKQRIDAWLQSKMNNI